MSNISKPILFAAGLTIIALASYFIYTTQNGKLGEYRPGSWYEGDTALNQAQSIYHLKKDAGEDFSRGPCLSNDLIPNWVADIAHHPRQAVDNRVENQCSAYLEGRARHFVELDINGNLIRIK